MFFFILLQFMPVMPDGADYYAETQAMALIKEPWNAFSSLTFWLPVFYWTYKLRGKYQAHWFLTACLPLLFIGGLGSALFHGFRTSWFLLLLDVLPILVLFVGLTLYFWQKILSNFLYLGVVVLVFGLVQTGISHTFLPPTSINLSYLWRGIALFLPAVLLLRSISYKGTRLLVTAILFFILALVFRSSDKLPEVVRVLYMGSHWLWHVSTVLGAFYLAEFLYGLPTWEREAKISAS